MKFALFANETKGQALDVIQGLSHYLKELGDEVVLEQAGFGPSFDAKSAHRNIGNSDFVVSIGGDGSILNLVHHIGIPHAPIVGVNLGSLGFLADIPAHDIFGGFEAIHKGAYHVSDRLVIEGGVTKSFHHFAVNEIAVHRGAEPHLVDLAIHVDGQFVNAFSADGVIVSTPSGSTAYSLAAGGPIVTPSLPALILTPICPHTISNKPIVFMPKESLSVELLHGARSVDVAFDGQPTERLEHGKALKICVSASTFRLVTLSTSDFFTTLRTKLNWTGSLRRK
jgi:NAD+ kinase